ncbi:hypothetical protein GCM10009836_42470 [Pseudonocardia ailaonensis]|uniref:PRC-barrel domain-containing protein n=1 Tax=Pseudonocardia ailaonensis TaxID=367279 RepID=A0ABN2NCR1_9PSEU
MTIEATASAPDDLVGLTVLGTGGEAFGTVDALLAGDTSGVPEWVVLDRAGRRTSPLPLAGGRVDGEALLVPYTEEELRTAPPAAGATLSPHQVAELSAHYGLRVETGPSGRHPAGRHTGREDDRAERDEVAAGADGYSAADAPDSDDDSVPGVRSSSESADS